jgi:hypothetical protein
VFVPFATLSDPGAEQGLFGCGECGAFGRHAFVFFGGGNPPQQFAGIGVARHDGRVAGFQHLRGGLKRIQTQTGFGFVRTVTGETSSRQQRLDLTRKIDLGLLRCDRCGCTQPHDRRHTQQNVLQTDHGRNFQRLELGGMSMREDGAEDRFGRGVKSIGRGIMQACAAQSTRKIAFPTLRLPSFGIPHQLSEPEG